MLLSKNIKTHLPFFKSNDIKRLEELGKNRNLVITSPDKGRGVVIMDRSDYNRKMHALLSDQSKFRKIDSEDIYKLFIKQEDKVHRCLRKLREDKTINTTQ